jgi:hypothetical protein
MERAEEGRKAMANCAKHMLQPPHSSLEVGPSTLPKDRSERKFSLVELIVTFTF